ncbi:hypothetical protein [Streptomyces sp. NPDC008092]|uniref:hypothetical protein n=1 Tax=Streptomyces sp. NPDC008092 TaxID=3364808 RepID=UPI0036EC5899
MTEPTREELLARVAHLEAALAATPYMPELPAEHDGEPITWRPWEEAPVILCAHAGDLNACWACAHPGPSLLAFGLAGPGEPRIRFNAHRCPSCQEMRVYAELAEVAYSPPRTVVRTPSSGQ